MLHIGDLVPHFTVQDIDGRRIEYATAVWQHRNLLLVALAAHEQQAATRHRAALDAAQPDFERLEAVALVTCNAVPGLRPPCALVADRWGEIAYIVHTNRAPDLPHAGELIQWLEYIQIRCAECEGEVR